MKPGKYLVWVLAAMTVFTCLFRLGANPVQLWDEARQAINLLEMRQSGHWLYTTFEHEPDFYNTKPPLLIWLQAATSTLTGLNEWALRIPSALAAMACCLLVFRIMRRFVETPNAAWIAVVALLSCQGFMAIHVARTGDYDALLSVWLMGSLAGFFLWSENRNEKGLYAGTICTLLAVFTKSTAGLLFLPGIALYLLGRKQLFITLLHKKNLLLAFFGAGLLVSWYLYREAVHPGYFHAVLENELGGRYFRQSETHGGPWWYYLNHITREGCLLFIPALTGYLLSFRRNHLAALGFIATCVFLVLISISATKISWYAAPVYPLLAMGYGFLGATILQRFPTTTRVLTVIITVPALLIWLAGVIWPIYQSPILQQPGPEDEVCLYMRNGPDAEWGRFSIVTGEYHPQISWYNAWLARKGAATFNTKSVNAVNAGDSVLVWHENQLRPIRQQFHTRLIKQERHLHFLLVEEARRQIPNFAPTDD